MLSGIWKSNCCCPEPTSSMPSLWELCVPEGTHHFLHLLPLPPRRLAHHLNLLWKKTATFSFLPLTSLITSPLFNKKTVSSPIYKKLTFCIMSISSGLKSLSIEEMLSMLFFRTIPAAKGFAMTPGDAWTRDKGEKKPIWFWFKSGSCVCCDVDLLNIYLHACNGSGVKAITHQHDQGISCGTQDPDCLCMSHAKETVIAHLQDSHAHLQTTISGCGATGAHLNSPHQLYILSHQSGKHGLSSKSV